MNAVAAVFACLIGLALLASPAGAGQYDLEIAEAEKKFWEIGGYLEGRYYGHAVRSDSAMAKLKLPGDSRDVINDWRLQAQVRGSVGQEKVKFHFLTNHQYQETFQEDGFKNQAYEAYLSLKPTSTLTIDAGKKVRLWGKGYAWNPAGFISRPKDPDEPELNLEGYTGLELEYVKSFARPDLANAAFTAVVLPVWDWENIPLGQPGDVDLAAKLYFLLFDTDLDFMFFNGPSQPTRLGLDFSRNIRENFEIHGEAAVSLDALRREIGANQQMTVRSENQLSFLFGLRYLTVTDTTFIAEYYHNGQGYGRDSTNRLYDTINQAWQKWQTTGDPSYLARASNLARPYLGQANFGTDYFYLRTIQNEPLGILYSSAWLTTIVNLVDWSFSLSPGASYKLTTNLELNLKGVIPVGGQDTEFGEKLDRLRVELYARYYF